MMAMQTFINLPVKDLTKATDFFAAIGFSFDRQFTDENATRVIVSDQASVMLLVEPFFRGFVEPQDVADTSRSREVVVGLAAESREQVDELTDKALAAGGSGPGGAGRSGLHVHARLPRPGRPSVVLHLHGHVRDPRGVAVHGRPQHGRYAISNGSPDVRERR
jgi:predicted lactoylglutathione lyase